MTKASWNLPLLTNKNHKTGHFDEETIVDEESI